MLTDEDKKKLLDFMVETMVIQRTIKDRIRLAVIIVHHTLKLLESLPDTCASEIDEYFSMNASCPITEWLRFQGEEGCDGL